MASINAYEHFMENDPMAVGFSVGVFADRRSAKPGKQRSRTIETSASPNAGETGQDCPGAADGNRRVEKAVGFLGH